MKLVTEIVCGLSLVLCLNSVIATDSKVENKTEPANGKALIGSKQFPLIKSSYSGRIVNGKTADIASYPYIVRLRYNNIGICGASVITLTHVFTVAHCLYKNQNPATLTLHGGSTSQTKGGTVFYASKVIIHHGYNPETQDYDAGIVQIKNTFQGHKNIAPIALQDAEVPGGTSCYAVGWGLTNYDKQTTPDDLQYAILQTLSSQQCSAAWSGFTTNRVLCAQQTKNGDVCKGDSGGPLVCNGKLTGATSYGNSGCRSKMPSVFTKVIHTGIRQFIRTNAGI